KLFKVGQIDPATARGLRRAVEVGRQLVAAGLGKGGRAVNGWQFPPSEVGNYGDNFPLRAGVARHYLAALSPEEAVYLTAEADDKGRPLGGKHRYVLRFEKGQAPPADAFWSVTMYRLPERLFVPNEQKRYAVGDRTKGLRYGPDGSLVFYLQRESPGKGKEANWLPTPEGNFCLALRAFLPPKHFLDR